jgi:hypothetical protein
MKITLPTKKNQGSVLLVCLGAALIIGFALTSYLLMIQGENQQVARSQGWNNSMVLTESGVEEGLALVNKLVGVTPYTSGWTNTAVSSDGWTWTPSTKLYTLQRNVPNGYYKVWVTNVDSSTVWIKSMGNFYFTNKTVQSIQRSVLASAAISGVYQGALMTKQTINLSGSATIDSYNSTDPLHSSNGVYVASMRSANANVMSMASTANSIRMSGGNIYGHVYYAAGGSINQSGSATIGDTSFAGPGIQSGWSAGTANVTIPDAPALPSVAWQPMPAPVGINYTITGSGPGTITYVQIPSGFGNLSGSATITITNGPVYLDIEGNFQMSGSSALIVSPGASLKAWINENSFQVSGSGVVNGTGSSTNVTFYGTPNCTTIQYSGSSAFIGSLNAPYANVQWSGSAAIYGAVVANSFDDSGGSALHFDEALFVKNQGAYLVGSWQEVAP